MHWKCILVRSKIIRHINELNIFKKINFLTIVNAHFCKNIKYLSIINNVTLLHKCFETTARTEDPAHDNTDGCY